MKIYGNVVAPEAAGYGYIDIADGKISDVVINEQCRKDAEWILPGFIDSHLHGLLAGAAIAEKVHRPFSNSLTSGAHVAKLPDTSPSACGRSRS